MNETPETIRVQMEETKSQLTDKLESLEHQVSETVLSTGTAVNATVEAVQVTVETVTGAVQGAVTSVSNAFDLGRQMKRHPWLVLGGSVVLGYLAGEFLAGSGKKRPQVTESKFSPLPTSNNANQDQGRLAAEASATSAAIIAAYKSGLKNSSWHQLKSVMFGTLVGMIQDVASRAVPQIMNCFASDQAGPRTSEFANDAVSSSDSPNWPQTSDTNRHLHVVSSDTVRSGNSF